MIMFSDEDLEQIFNHSKTANVPIQYQAIMIGVIDEVLSKKERKNADATISKS